MFFLPLPLVMSEFLIFYLAVQQWGFWNTLGIYFLPCLLGFLIVSIVGQLTLFNLQSSLRKGQLPGNQLLSSGALFLSGLFFMLPSFFARIVAVVLFLPGLRHLVLWWFKAFMAKKLAQGAAFGSGTWGARAGGGFRFYRYDSSEKSGFDDKSEEQVLDIKPLEVTHEIKKTDHRD